MSRTTCGVGFAIFAFLLGGCASQNVYFFDQIAHSGRPNATQIYVDAFGNLYPRDGLPENFLPSKRDGGSLLSMVKRKASGFCRSAPEATETYKLCQTDGDRERWEQTQNDLWRERAQHALSSLSASGENEELVILIHGFNNSREDASRAYDDAKRRILQTVGESRKDSLHFIDLYWDGHKSRTGVGAWGNAQASGPLVGFSFRRFLNAIRSLSLANRKAPPRIRIVAHSSGAFVVGSLLGNPTAALPLLRRKQREGSPYDRFQDDAASQTGSFAVPQFDDLRVALFAAATSSDTFTGTRKHPGGVLVEGAKFYLSVMPKDKVLTKLFLGADFPWSGATGLGAKYGYFCGPISNSSALSDRDVTFFGYDFEREKAEWGDAHNEHDFRLYIEQAALSSGLFSDLFSKGGEQTFVEGPRINCDRP